MFEGIDIDIKIAFVDEVALTWFTDTESNLSISEASFDLPGILHLVTCPNYKKNHYRLCTDKITLRAMIIHLNDDHKWSRDQIADWLDELADKGEINIDFPTPNKKD